MKEPSGRRGARADDDAERALRRCREGRTPERGVWEGVLGDLEEEARRRFGDGSTLHRRLWVALFSGGVALRLTLGRIAPRRGARRARSAWRGTLLAPLLADFRHAGRSLRRAPGFTLAVVLTLGLCVGLNSALFSIANALLLRHVPAAAPERLGRLVAVEHDGRPRGLSRPAFRWLEAQPLPFSSLGAEALLQIAVDGMEATSLLGHAVSPAYFETLGTRAVLGRPLSSLDGHPAAEAVAVVSHRLWHARLGGASDAVGGPLRLNSRTFTVVGVLDPEFTGTLGAARVDVWVPLAQAEAWLGADTLDRPGARALSVFARLAPDATRHSAAAALDLAGAAFRRAHPELDDATLRLDEALLVPQGPTRRSATLFLAGLQGLVLLVVLVACANLTNLFLTRAVSRSRQTAMRLSLGASRGAIARLAACESLLLALLGGGAALVLGSIGARTLLHSLPVPALPIHLDLRPDLRVLAATFGITVVAGLVVSLAPIAMVRRADLTSSLRAGDPHLVASRSPLRRALVVAQVSVSLVLLASGGLLFGSLRRAGDVDPGFGAEGAFAMDLELAAGGTVGEAEGRATYDALLERVRAQPEIERAALAYLTPLDLATPRTGIELPGLEPPPNRLRTPTSYRVVGEDYFAALEIPILDGRPFDARDGGDGEPVAIVNQTMAERYWPESSALGRTFRWGRLDDERTPSREVRIVGVARDVKLRTLGEEPTPHVYLPFAQAYEPAMTLIATTRGAPVEAMAAVRRALADLPGPPQSFFGRTLEQQVDFALAPARFAAAVAGLLATLAVALSSLGLYGVLSYSVAQRRREIGLRVALGAGRGGVSRLVVGDGLLLVLWGLLLGAVLAWPVRGALAGLPFGVAAHDLGTLVAGALLLVLSGALASWLPTRRALGLSPAEVLRSE